jgi:hypothetical protein
MLGHSVIPYFQEKPRTEPRKAAAAPGARTPGGLVLFAERTRPDASNTPQGKAERHPGGRPFKLTGGRNGKSFLSRREIKPWRGKNPGEVRAGTAVIPPRQATNFRRDQARAGRARGRGVEPRNRLSSDKPVEEPPKCGTDLRKVKPPKGSTPGASPARNKAGRLREDQAVKRVRNPEGGSVGGWYPRPWILGASNAVGEQTPWEWLHPAGGGAAVPAKL